MSPQPNSSYNSPKPALMDTGKNGLPPNDNVLNAHEDLPGTNNFLSSSKKLSSEERDILARGFTEIGNKRRHQLDSLIEELQPFIKKRTTFDPDEFKEEIKGLIQDNYLTENEKRLLFDPPKDETKKKTKNRIRQRVRNMYKSLKQLLKLHARSSSTSSLFLDSSQASSSEASSSQASSQAASDMTMSSDGSLYHSADIEEEEEDDSNDDESDEHDDEKAIDVDSKEEARSKTRKKEKKPPTMFMKKRKDPKSTVNKRSALVSVFNEGDRELFSLFHSVDPATNTSESSMSSELEFVDDTALEDSTVVKDVLNTLLTNVYDTVVEDSAVVKDVLNNLLVGVEKQLQPSSSAAIMPAVTEQSDVLIDPNKHPLLYAVTGISKRGSNFVKCGVTAGRKVKFNSRCRGYHPGKQKLIRL